jgi:hypothetical protein
MLRLATPLTAFAVAGASLALAACGSSSDSGSSSSSTSTNGSASSGQSGTRNADFQKFQQCLRDNGVTLPNRGNRAGGSNAAPPNTAGGAPQGAPGAGGSTATPPNGTPPQGGGYGGGPGGYGGGFGGQSSNPKFQKAMQACAKYRPQGNFRGGNRQGNGTGRSQFNIRAFTPYLTCLKSKGLDVKVSDGFNALRDLKQSDPKVQAAFKSCQSKLPQRPQASGAAPANTGTNGNS